MEMKMKSVESSSVNDRPYIFQNGMRRPSGNQNGMEISEFRAALPQFLAVSVKNILLFVYGMTLGFPTIVIPAIQGGEGREPSDIVLNIDQISWFSSINLICVPLGCVFSGVFSQPIGKRRAMQVVNLPILASWLLFHFATRTEHLYAALFLSGLGGGLMEAPVLTYVAEVTQPRYRGILSALGSTCVISGVFIQFILGSLLDWRTIAAVSTVFPVICIIALCFIPESPTWLIRKHKYHEAVKALQWLRGWVPDYRVEEEFNMLYDQLITQPALEDEKDGTNKDSQCSQRLKIFRKRSFCMPFLLVAFTFFVGHFSGKTALQTYAVQIFHTLKAPINKYHATILLGMAELIATVLSVFLIHFTGKRPLVLTSTIGTGLCFLGTATYAYHLNVVPGFAVDNVVANISSLVPKESIITKENITRIFDAKEKALVDSMDLLVTTMLPDIVEGTTFGEIIHPTEYDGDRNRSRRDTEDESTTEGAAFFLTTTEESTTIGSVLNMAAESAMEQAILPEDNESENINTIVVQVPKQKQNRLLWLPLVLLLGSAFFAHLGIRLIPWVLIGEVFPPAVRGTASGLVSGVGYLFGFLANKLFLQMLALLTLPGTFWLYSSVALGGAFILYFVLPETEGRTLGEIEAHFSKKSASRLNNKKGTAPKLSQKTTEPPSACTRIQLDNLQMPLDSRTAKTIQLQQSDLVHRNNGRANPGYDGDEANTTTHL